MGAFVKSPRNTGWPISVLGTVILAVLAAFGMGAAIKPFFRLVQIVGDAILKAHGQ